MLDTLRAAAGALMNARDQVYALRACRILAGALADAGRLSEAVTWADHAVGVSNWSKPPYFLTRSLVVAAYVARTAGNPERAVSMASEAVRLAEHDDFVARSDADDELCRALVAAGRATEAVVVGRNGLAVSEGLGGYYVAYANSTLGRALFVSGDIGGALERFRIALRLFATAGIDPPDFGWAATALSTVRPELGATALGAHDRLTETNPDPDLRVPEHLLAPVRARYERDFAEAIARGLELTSLEIARLLDAVDLGTSQSETPAG
jgi:tetratricopeptide (TPR) repeat protein